MSFYENANQEMSEWSLGMEQKVIIRAGETEMKKIFRLMVFRKVQRASSIGICPLPAHKQIHTQITEKKIAKDMERLMRRKDVQPYPQRFSSEQKNMIVDKKKLYGMRIIYIWSES